MTDYKELIERAKDQRDRDVAEHCPAEIIALQDEVIAGLETLIDRLEKAEKDAERLDWLKASTEMHGFCHIGYGDFRYYAHQQDGYKTVRQVIDSAMEASK